MSDVERLEEQISELQRDVQQLTRAVAQSAKVLDKVMDIISTLQVESEETLRKVRFIYCS